MAWCPPVSAPLLGNCCRTSVGSKIVRTQTAHYIALFYLAFLDACRAFETLTITQTNLDAPAFDQPGFHINWTHVSRGLRRNGGVSDVVTAGGKVIPLSAITDPLHPHGPPVYDYSGVTYSVSETLTTIDFIWQTQRYRQTWELSNEYTQAEMESDFRQLVGAMDFDAFLARTQAGVAAGDLITWGSGSIVHSEGGNLAMLALANYMGECGYTVDASIQNRDGILPGAYDLLILVPDGSLVKTPGTYFLTRFCSKAEVRITAPPYCKRVFDLKGTGLCPVASQVQGGYLPPFICSTPPTCEVVPTFDPAPKVAIIDTSNQPYGYGELYSPNCSDCNEVPPP